MFTPKFWCCCAEKNSEETTPIIDQDNKASVWALCCFLCSTACSKDKEKIGAGLQGYTNDDIRRAVQILDGSECWVSGISMIGGGGMAIAGAITKASGLLLSGLGTIVCCAFFAAYHTRGKKNLETEIARLIDIRNQYIPSAAISMPGSSSSISDGSCTEPDYGSNATLGSCSSITSFVE